MASQSPPETPEGKSAMSHEPGPGPDTALVAAARNGDPQAVEGLLSQSLPLVYNIVGRALDGHGDVDDVVQETLLRVVRGLDRLEQPESYRSWMVAITVRQTKDWFRAQRQSRQTRTALPQAEHVPDASDFASLTILRLNLTDQRREVAEATRWLDEDDRELLSLWWLEETGQLKRSELAAALGLSGRHTATRVRRLKDRLDIGRGIVRAMAAQPPCPELDGITRDWDGAPNPLWRKRLARHVRDCARCGGRTERLVPVEGLLRGLPLVAPPLALYQALLEAVRSGAPYGAAHAGPAGPDHTAPGDARIGSEPAGTPVPNDPGTSGEATVVLSSHRRTETAGHRRARPRGIRQRRVLVATSAGAVVASVLIAVSVTGNAPATPGGTAPAPASLTAEDSPAARRSAPSSPSPAPSASKPVTASPSSSPAAKPPSPSAAPSTAPAVPEPGDAEAVASDKKGVAVWQFNGADTALRQSGAGWYYTWSTGHPGINTPAGVEFVPMIWGADSVTPQALAEAKAAGTHLLGFNEPDMPGQADMTVEEALSLWPRLEETGSTLGSPAVAYGGDTEGGWLDRFMDGAEQRGYRVDFITLHWYGGDFRTDAAVEQLRSYLTAVYEKYRKPIWLTEYALIDFSNGTRYPTEAEQAAFVTASTKMLSGLPFLKRYAWFGLGTDETGPSTALFRSGPTGPTLTDTGRAFLSAP